MKVNDQTRKIIGKELPWLPALIPEGAKEFFVQLIDMNTLSLQPRGKTLHDGEWCSYDRILLLTDEGTQVGEVGKKIIPEHVRHIIFPILWKTVPARKESFSESVEGTLARVPEAEHVRYILQIESEIFRDESDRDRLPRVTLHKLPKRGPNLKTWLEQKAGEETARLREKLAEADK